MQVLAAPRPPTVRFKQLKKAREAHPARGARDGMRPHPPSGNTGVAPYRPRPRRAADASPASESFAAEIEAARAMLDQGRSGAAEARLRSLIGAARGDQTLLARARCLLSVALEMQGRFADSLEAVKSYETSEARARLDAETAAALRVQVSLAYNYTGDHPKAIALLNRALERETAASSSGGPSDARLGAVYAALSRVYRSIAEYPIARDHARQALEHYRHAGDWRGLAEAYFALAMTDMKEGDQESALANFEQAVKLIGDRPAPYVLGRIYGNMAGCCWFLRRPHDGIRYLERAIAYYERTENKENAAVGYNNLGINLTLVGQWGRAHEALSRALELAYEFDERGAQVPTILESVGELCMLRGDLEEARELLERSVDLANEHGNKWYAAQSMRTLGRCHLALGDAARALVSGEAALSLARGIGDRQAVSESTALLAEAHLAEGEVEECAALLRGLAGDAASGADETSKAATPDMAVAGEAERLSGMLALAQGDAPRAVNHFGRSLSIFEILGDRYRIARAHYWLGRAHSAAAPARAGEHLELALREFRELGARLDTNRAEEALARIGTDAPARQPEPSTVAQLLTLRLAEATASRELLLRELAAVVHQETGARRVLVVEPGEEPHAARVVAAHGCAPGDGARLAALLNPDADVEAESELIARAEDAGVFRLRPAHAPPAILFVSPRAEARLPGGAPLDSLLRVAELGLDVCALRARGRGGGERQAQGALGGADGLSHGFIHNSPAMARLVEEMHKIRSSDVTVLITGESGTGKELIARAIHALSSRREKIFVPFNCTAVPKELAEGYLFGYRRGAFTGAVSDSPGVVRSAASGTLFLDEVGDLPADVQPKLLRFLQEGEIQPLGEQRPQKVDVRIVAATNTDLERMVAEGRFREDLYYRLNVIRLRVPPLRERRSEIPILVSHYVNHYAAKFNRRDVQITPETVDLLTVADWPGNVRQLTNEIQRIVARAEDGTLITPDHLSPDLRGAVTAAPPSVGLASATRSAFDVAVGAGGAARQGLKLADALGELERHMIAEAMRKHGGNISRASRELGLTRRGLYLKLERHQMKTWA